ncbi:hypothetical protein K0M31_000787 [Melipona bicolor]|uniref:Uncharacterized protein n=1 Tax=Melipona bicolor TaxID=60889 RepID=A0AA40GEI0_9HYME|nr:hypothetical protein K0M31_000787 [Melipona bicolor]
MLFVIIYEEPRGHEGEYAANASRSGQTYACRHFYLKDTTLSQIVENVCRFVYERTRANRILGSNQPRNLSRFSEPSPPRLTPRPGKWPISFAARLKNIAHAKRTGRRAPLWPKKDSIRACRAFDTVPASIEKLSLDSEARYSIAFGIPPSCLWGKILLVSEQSEHGRSNSKLPVVALCNENDDDDDDDDDEDNDNDNDDDDDDAEHDADRPSRRAMPRGEGTFLRRRCSFESEKDDRRRVSQRKKKSGEVERSREKKEKRKGVGKSGRTVVRDERETGEKKKAFAGNTARTPREHRPTRGEEGKKSVVGKRVKTTKGESSDD